MKIKTTHNRKEKTSALTVRTTKGEKLEYAQAELLHQGGISCFLPFFYEQEKDEVIFSYDTSDLVSLKVYLDAKLSLDQFHSLLSDVIGAVENCGDNNLTYTTMLFDLDQVFLESDANRVKFAYIPASGMSETRSTITDLLRNIATKVKFICDEDRVHAHDLVDFLKRQTVFSLVDFKSFLANGHIKRRDDNGLTPIEGKTDAKTPAKAFDFLKSQAGSVSAQEVRQNQSLAEKIAFDVADTPSAPIASKSAENTAQASLLDDHVSSMTDSTQPSDDQAPISADPTPPFADQAPFFDDASGPSSTSFLGSGVLDSGSLNSPKAADKSDIQPKHQTSKPFYLVQVANEERTLLPIGNTSIGRSSRCDISVKGNTNISREHACFRIENEACFLIDRNSTNKCSVNEETLLPEIPFEVFRGATIKLADECFRLE